MNWAWGMIGIVTLAVASLPVPAQADELQDSLVAAARAMRTEHYEFRRETVVEQTGQPPRTIVEHYNPGRAAAQAWTLASIDGKPPGAKEAKDAARAKRGPLPSYSWLARWLGSPATRTGGGEGYVTYRYVRLPKGTVMMGSHDASADMQADVRVNTGGATPFVERVTYRTTKGFRVQLVAKVEGMVATSTYRRLPGGMVVPDTTSNVTRGSMLGKSGEIKSSTTYSGFRPVR